MPFFVLQWSQYIVNELLSDPYVLGRTFLIQQAFSYFWILRAE